MNFELLALNFGKKKIRVNDKCISTDQRVASIQKCCLTLPNDRVLWTPPYIFTPLIGRSSLIAIAQHEIILTRIM